MIVCFLSKQKNNEKYSSYYSFTFLRNISISTRYVSFDDDGDDDIYVRQIGKRNIYQIIF